MSILHVFARESAPIPHICSEWRWPIDLTMFCPLFNLVFALVPRVSCTANGPDDDISKPAELLFENIPRLFPFAA
jgi:hypothetical protein